MSRDHRRTKAGRIQSDIIGRSANAFRKTTPAGGKNQADFDTYFNQTQGFDEEIAKLGVEIKLDDNLPLILIWDKKTKKELGDYGIFTTPIGAGRKRDRQFHEEIDASAISMYDLLFAFQLGIIGTTTTRRQYVYNELIVRGLKSDPDFLEKASVYMDLRQRGLLVMPGITYGVDFVVYSDTPEEFRSSDKKDHSTAMIDVSSGKQMNLTEAIKGEQLGKSINKQYMVASSDGKRNEEGHLDEMSQSVTYRYMASDQIGIQSNRDISAQIAKRLEGQLPIVAWELKSRY